MVSGIASWGVCALSWGAYCAVGHGPGPANALEPPRRGPELSAESAAEFPLWKKLTLSFTGPLADERDPQPGNPFLDYRLTVDFTRPSGETVSVPGYFAGDGHLGGSGDVWRVNLAPDELGDWSFVVRFRTGIDVAIDLAPMAGTPTAPDGERGTFTVVPPSEDVPGFHTWGLLEDVGGHYLKFRDGPYFLKVGVDSPENFLAYRGFDNTFDQPGGLGTSGLLEGLHRYPSHVADWRPRDPWFKSAETGYDARGIIGALNYLSSQGVNSIYFLPMNLGGDGRDTAPFVGFAKNTFDKTHYNVSKLAQWGVVLDHAQSVDILLHVVLAETEPGNENWLDEGKLGRERKLFFREMVARFGHAVALKWNLSEENDWPAADLRAFADYLSALDPYDHPIAFHTHVLPPGGGYGPYAEVLGDPRFVSTSIQTTPDFAGEHAEFWRQRSASSGRPWTVEIDELAPAGIGLTDTNAVELRKKVLYDVLFGGGQLEWYCGYHPLPLGGDLRLEDFRTREEMWTYSRHARGLMERELPFWEMQPMDSLVQGEHADHGGAEVFAKSGEVYAVYYPNASQTGTLDLSGETGTFRARWFDPRTGVAHPTSALVQGGAPVDVGAPAAGPLGPSVIRETGGLVVFEIEAVPPVSGWVSEDVVDGYSGTAYYRCDLPAVAQLPGLERLEYEFEVVSPGSYALSLRNFHDNPISSLGNDCWVRMDGGPWKRTFSDTGPMGVGQWNWDTQFDGGGSPAPAAFDLGVGVHRLEIAPRSPGFILDRCHLYLASVPAPLSLSLPASPVTAPPGTPLPAPEEDWVLLLKRQ